MKPIYVIGNGQLGRMLRQAGEPLGINVFLIDINNNKLEVIPSQESIITTEIEYWPKTPIMTKLAKQPSFINRDIFSQLTDRLRQKELLDSLALMTAPWRYLKNKKQWSELFKILGDFLIVKSRRGGYDGHGQWCITRDNFFLVPDEIYGQAIVEKVISFSNEVSLIGARNINNECVFYPLTYNFHQEGILRASIAFPQSNKKLQTEAESMLSTIMRTLNYVGVIAMEFFISNDKLFINELAPRVHNTGHWTQNGASISQFELHLRAISNLPIPSPKTETISIMINLIGTKLNTAWLSLPLIHLHWYEKDLRPGRKVGHLNLCTHSWQTINESLNRMQQLLPNEYNNTITWLNTKLICFQEHNT